MKSSVYRFVVLVVLLCRASSAFAQPEPYYKLPQDRTGKGVKTFPNLKPKLTKFYLRGEGGFLLQGSTLSNDFNGQLTTSSPVNLSWGAGIGFNYRDRWMTEIGYANTPVRLNSSFRISPFVIPIIEQYDFQSISLRFQRSVLVVDRISRSTRIFLGGGIHLNTNGKAAKVSNSSEAFLRQFSTNSPADTIRIAEITSLASTPITGELSVELRGKVVEALEIGVFAKALSSFKRPFQTNISYRVNNAPLNETSHTISPLAVRLGVTVHYNFGIITKYESDFK